MPLDLFKSKFIFHNIVKSFLCTHPVYIVLYFYLFHFLVLLLMEFASCFVCSFLVYGKEKINLVN